MTPIIYKSEDTIGIKSAHGIINMSASDVASYGISHNLGNCFVAVDLGSTWSGLAIRYFNITGDTIYLATTTYLDSSGYDFGWGEKSNISSVNSSLYNCDWGTTLTGAGVAFNPSEKVVNNIRYIYGGGNGGGSQADQGIYVPSTVINFYMDGEKLEPPVVPVTANGGGATHIAKISGLLSDIGSSNLEDIYIIAGGGGGALLIGEDEYAGKDAGGISGNGTNSANQTIGYAFGQGESGSKTASAGGGGLYGGYKGSVNNTLAGGAGSGYIGNPLLTNKKMVGYKVPESTDDSTKTDSSNSQSAIAKANTPKAGNGFARITFMMAKNFFPFKRWYSDVSSTFEPKIECYIENSNHEKKSYYRKSTTGGISYDAENIKRSAYYRNPEADPSSRYTAELCLIGDNGNLVSMNGDSEISSDEPVAHNLTEYLYYVSSYETHYNYLADIDLPIFFNYTDFKSYIQDLDDPVITSVSYNRFNKPFPKDSSDSTGEVTFKIQNEQTIKSLMFTLIATSSSSTTRSFKVGIRTSERGADVETKTFTYTSPNSSNQMPKYYYWGGLKYSGNIWVSMYNIEDANVWTPTWLEVFTETIPEPKTYRIENLMRTRDFVNDVIDIRVSGSTKDYRNITPEQIDSHKVIIAGAYNSAPALHDNENNKLYANKVSNNNSTTNYTFIPIIKSRIKSMLFDLTYTPRNQYSYFTIVFYKITGTGNNKKLEEVRTAFSTTTTQITLRNTVECNLETVDYIMIQNQGTTNASNIIYEITNFALDVI